MWDLIVSVPDHCLSFYFVSDTSRGIPEVVLLLLKCQKISDAFFF